MSSMVFYFLGVSVSLALLYVFYLLIHQNDTFFGLKRFYLLGIILFSLFIPFVNIPVVNTSTPEYSYMLDSITVYADSINYGIGSKSYISGYIITIYLLGFSLFTLRFLIMMAALINTMRKSRKKIINGKRIYFTKSGGQHYSFLGLVFIGEVDSKEEMERIIEHEFVHVRKGHTIDILFLEVISIILWFNPFIYLVKRSLKIVHEYQTDHILLEKGINRLEYQKLLLSMTFGGKTSILANGFNKSFLKKRFLMMSKIKSPSWLKIKLIVLLPVFAVLIFLFSCVKEQIGDLNLDPVGVELKSQDQFNNSVKKIEEKYGFYEVKIAPQYPGGEQELINFIASNVKYPEEARENGIAGKVFVKFVISRSGKVKNISIKKGVHKLLDDEAIQVLSLMEDWSPGLDEDGNPVNVEMIMPINFRLN